MEVREKKNFSDVVAEIGKKKRKKKFREKKNDELKIYFLNFIELCYTF